eukprot:TRINITY_DN8702_c0_g1_i12.p1 TRINITY_DN8702_c0_g1~~TRINITY_DN8702_c0_g1_i12.p1  ORF type:complete len:281 (+),score=12.24 TRINITY_DN8702_c0_g1_i12:194-1036(+)
MEQISNYKLQTQLVSLGESSINKRQESRLITGACKRDSFTFEGQNSNERTPILFFHGIGIGLLPYLPFIRQLMGQFHDRPIIVACFRNVSMRWGPTPKRMSDITANIVRYINQEGYDNVHLVGHSYGTIVASYMVQNYKKVVNAVCLLDPVCMLMCYPTLVQNFLYNKLNYYDNLLTVVGDVIRFLLARDLNVQKSLNRNFWWSEVTLWPEDIPHRAVLSFGSYDNLLPTKLVLEQLKRASNCKNVKVMVHETAGHAEIIIDWNWADKIIKEFHSVIASK